MLRYTAGRLLIVGALPTAVLLLAGPWLFGLVFGPTWTEAGDYARILAVAYLAQFVVNPSPGCCNSSSARASHWGGPRHGSSLPWAARVVRHDGCAGRGCHRGIVDRTRRQLRTHVRPLPAGR